MSVLFIDTSDFETVTLALIDQEVVQHKLQSRQLSESLIKAIKKFCKKQQVRLEQIDKLAVVVGPGRFSRIRTAVATANALAFVLNSQVIRILAHNIPKDLKKLVSVKGKKLAFPVYDRAPNITIRSFDRIVKE